MISLNQPVVITNTMISQSVNATNYNTVLFSTLLFRYCLQSLQWSGELLHPPDASLRQTYVVKQEILKASQTALYYKGIVVILNSLHPLCFCEEVIVECWCGNNFLCRGGTFAVLNYKKKTTRPWCSGWTLWLRKPCSPFNLFHLIKRENSVWPALWGGRPAAGIWAKTAGSQAQGEELAKPMVVKVHTYMCMYACPCVCLSRGTETYACRKVYDRMQEYIHGIVWHTSCT